CIDCGVCEPECPIEAIVDDTGAEGQKFLELNREYAEKWPNITRQKPPLPEAEAYKDKKDKYPSEFSNAPGEGD
ncbi:MAG: DUF3470 domain-containing protein, partial [Alphaproteobacteria bacterium]|nr:DUF3470 domain-containing protein [Alphaproteobacteria bacterium]